MRHLPRFRSSLTVRIVAMVGLVGMVLYYRRWLPGLGNEKNLVKGNIFERDFIKEPIGSLNGNADAPPAPNFLDTVGSNRDVLSFRASLRSSCVFPELELHDSEIMKFFKVLPRVTCEPGPEWVTIHKGNFIITADASKEHKNIRCDAYPIVKVNDFKTTELDPIRNIPNNTKVDNDFYRVECSSEDGAVYKNYHAGIRYDETVQKRQGQAAHGLNLDVIMLGLDSTSRLAWHRHLPKTTEYFLKVLNGTELEGYNILGDGTPAAIMPILIGHREEELPEARRGYPGAKTVDNYPWIWEDFKKAGYATAWGEDDASLGTFQYRLLGFQDAPVDHYYRYFSVAIGPHYGDFKPDCLGGSRPRHTILYDYMTELFHVYPDRRKWIFTFQSELSHKDNNKLSMMDDDVLEHLQRMSREGFLDNAMLILMADHGGRFSKVRATAQGKQEERLPYFGFSFPPWFHQRHPDIIRNLKTNAKRLTTPFDIHETFHEILNFTGAGKADISKRGVSLFKEIPLERDCDSANVDPHWCACLEWTKVDINSKEATGAITKALEMFNNFTAPYRELCSLLQVGRVESALAFKAKDAVLKFKDTRDGGRGRFGDMTDTTKHSKVLYQITFFTHPGEGRFEVTVVHNLLKDIYLLDPKDISRTNVYGKDPKCVEYQEPFLRPFCYCKDNLKT